MYKKLSVEEIKGKTIKSCFFNRDDLVLYFPDNTYFAVGKEYYPDEVELKEKTLDQDFLEIYDK